MPDPSDPRRLAYDKLISALPALLNDEAREALCDWLLERQVLQDGQEDPGAVMVEGLETELAIAETFRQLAERLQCRPSA